MSFPEWLPSQPPSHPAWRRMRLRQDFEDSQVASRLDEQAEDDVLRARPAAPVPRAEHALPPLTPHLPLPPHLASRHPRRRHAMRARAPHLDPMPPGLRAPVRRGGVPAWPTAPEKKRGTGRWAWIAVYGALAAVGLWVATHYLAELVWALSGA